MLKRIMIIVLAVGMLAAVTACGSNAQKPETTSDHSDLVKIADGLYEITYTALDEDYLMTDMPEVAGDPAEADMACSVVRNGNFYGRNFDWSTTDMPNFIVHVTAAEDRCASLAVCAAFPLTREDVDAGLGEDIYPYLPMFVLDGINEHGVVCNLNVVPGDDTAMNTGTAPGKADLYQLGLLRYVLDHATSARNAIELLQERNIYNTEDFTDCHFMIADPEETYVVEIIDNELRWGTSDTVMTNYYLLTDEPTPHSTGLERASILREHYGEGATLEGMAALMQRVKFSLAFDPDNTPAWYSENNMDYTEYGWIDLTVDSSPEDHEAALWEGIEEFRQHEGESGYEFWYSLHTSIYDIAARTLRLYLNEDYDNYYTFPLDGASVQ